MLSAEGDDELILAATYRRAYEMQLECRKAELEAITSYLHEIHKTLCELPKYIHL